MSSITRRIRDLYELFEAEAKPYGASVNIQTTNGGHLRAVFKIGTRQAFVIMSRTPKSEWRANSNAVSDARRTLRRLSSETINPRLRQPVAGQCAPTLSA